MLELPLFLVVFAIVVMAFTEREENFSKITDAHRWMFDIPTNYSAWLDKEKCDIKIIKTV